MKAEAFLKAEIDRPQGREIDKVQQLTESTSGQKTPRRLVVPEPGKAHPALLQPAQMASVECTAVVYGTEDPGAGSESERRKRGR
jgi:hypothetical protein